MAIDSELEQIRHDLDISYSLQKHHLEHLLVFTKQKVTDLEEKLKHTLSQDLRKQLLEQRLMLDHSMQELHYLIRQTIQYENFAKSSFFTLFLELEAKPTSNELREERELQEEMTLALKEAEQQHLENRHSLYEEARKLRLTPYR